MANRQPPIRSNPPAPSVTQPRQPLGQEHKGNMVTPGDNNGRAGPEGERERNALRGWLDKNRGLDWS